MTRWSFAAAPGWHEAEAALDPGRTVLTAWTANVPFDERDLPVRTGFPFYTLRSLPHDGIVVTVMHPNPVAASPEPKGDLSPYPSLTLPLSLEEAKVRQPTGEEPGRPMTVYEIDAVIEGELVTVITYVGTNEPTRASLAAAQGALSRLTNNGSSAVPPASATPMVSATIPYPHDGAHGGGIAVGAGSIWIGVASGDQNADGSIVRVDPTTNRIVAEIPVAGPTFRHRMAATPDAVWVASTGSDVVERIDPSTNAVVARIELGAELSALAADDSAVWVVAIHDRSDTGQQNTGRLVRIDPATNEVVAGVPLGQAATGYEDEVVIGAGSVWVLGPRLVDQDSEDGGDLVRVDMQTNEVTAEIPVDGFHMVLAEDQRSIWVRSPRDGVFDESSEPWVWRTVDVATNAVSAPFRIPSAFEGGLSSVSDTALWAVSYDANDWPRVARFNPQTLELEATSDSIRQLYTDAIVDTDSGTAWITAIDDIVRVDLGSP